MNRKLCKYMKDKGTFTKDLCELCRNKHVCAKKSLKMGIVKSKDLFDKTKNPKLSISAKDILANDSIPKTEVIDDTKR